MRKWILCLLFFPAATVAWSQQAVQNRMYKKRVILPAGWSLTPAGHNLPLGDLPRDIAISSGKKYLAVIKNRMDSRILQLIDAGKEKILDEIPVPGADPVLKFSADEKSLYLSGGGDNYIRRYEVVHNRLVAADSLLIGEAGKGSLHLSSLDIDDKRSCLYVVTGDERFLYRIDLSGKTAARRFELPGEGYGCLLAKDGGKLFVSCRSCDRVMIFDTELLRFTGEIPAAGNGGDLCLSGNGHLLFESHQAEHAVSVIDLVQGRLLQKLEAGLPGATNTTASVNGLALGEDEKTLYIANGDYNCLAVFDISQPGAGHLKGLIPVGWYPTAVELAGNRIFVANGKGFSSLVGPADNGNTKNASREFRYIMGLFTGSLSVLEEPGDQLLGTYSKLVYQNCPHTTSTNNRSAYLSPL